MKHVGIEIKFYNLDTFKKQIDVNFIDLDSNSVDLNYKAASLIFCHFWRTIGYINYLRTNQTSSQVHNSFGPVRTLAICEFTRATNA